MKKNNILRDRYKVPSLKFFYVLSGIFSILAIIAFCWQKQLYLFNKNYVADTNLLGSLGDFIGGILGAVFSLFSCILLFKTLTLQQEESQANYKELELQRFNNVFLSYCVFTKKRLQNCLLRE